MTFSRVMSSYGWFANSIAPLGQCHQLVESANRPEPWCGTASILIRQQERGCGCHRPSEHWQSGGQQMRKGWVDGQYCQPIANDIGNHANNPNNDIGNHIANIITTTQHHNITATSRQHHGNITGEEMHKRGRGGLVGGVAWAPATKWDAGSPEHWLNIEWIFSESKVYPCVRQYLFQPIVMLTCIKSVLLNANKESIKLILLSFHICMGLVIREAGSGIIGGGLQNSIFCKSPQQ